jgi:plastocyanin
VKKSLFVAGAVTAITALAAACGGGAQKPAGAPPPGLATAPAGTGRITGTVHLTGPHPEMQSEPVSQNTNVCGSTVRVTRLALGADNGVQNAFVYLQSVDGQADPGDGGQLPVLTIQQKGCEYTPHAMTLEAGAQIEMVNDDPILHNVHAKELTPNGLETVFNIAQPIQGQRTKFDPHLKPGIVALTCEAGHPWMSAYLLVTSNPFAAVTDAHGNFHIDDVPAGTYAIKMWHEGVRLKRIVASLQEFDYENPYEATEQVVVTPGGDARIDFAFALRAVGQQARATNP